MIYPKEKIWEPLYHRFSFGTYFDNRYIKIIVVNDFIFSVFHFSAYFDMAI